MKKYDEIEIEIVILASEDVIRTSDPFDSSDDSVSGW